jgi:predicted enzyme related to lactoylglutathione lyase
MIKNIRHTGIVVRDLAKMSKFYRSLGFIDDNSALEEGSFIEQVTGIKNVKLEWVKMKAPDGYLLELLQYHSHAIHTEVTNQKPNQLGCSHMAFTVDDITQACESIIDAGGSIINEPITSPNGNVKVTYCYDPEGVLMEIVEVIKE